MIGEAKYAAKIPATSAAGSDMVIVSEAFSNTTDLKYEEIFTRPIKKFDLLVTCESLIKNGIVETGRAWKSAPVYKTYSNGAIMCDVTTYC